MSIKITIDLRNIFEGIYNLIKPTLSKFNIGHLLLISFALHLFAMTQPSDGGMVFDEVHYIKATRAHLEGIGANAEHTPLVKVFMSVVFSIFGDYWFAWRFPIVVSCMISYIAFYYIAKHFLEEKYALVATAFLCFDVMYFIHGTIYLLDMPAIMFGILGFAFYLYKHYKLSAVSMALAVLSKEIALLFVVALVFYALFSNIRKKKVISNIPLKEKIKLRKNSKGEPLGVVRKLKTCLICFLIFSAVMLSFILVYDNIYKISKGDVINIIVYNNIVNNETGYPITTEIWTDTHTSRNYITNPIDHLKLFLTYHTEWMTNLNSSSSGFEKPWNWILPASLDKIISYPTYFGVKVTVGDKTYDTISWKGQGNIFIWYSFWLVLPMSILMLLRRKETKISFFLISWICITYFFFFVMELIKHSTGFNYYFIYTVPALCLGIPFFWKEMPISSEFRNICIITHLALTIIFFVCFFPINLVR